MGQRLHESASLDDALNRLPLVQREANGEKYWAASRFFYQHIPSLDAKQRKGVPLDAYIKHSDGKRKISQGSGADKAYLNTLHLSHIRKAFAFGVGDVDRVDWLLQSVTHFGGLSRAGYGKVVEAKADEFEHDWSEMIDGKCVRPMPRKLLDADAIGACRPPYWNKSIAVPVCLPVGENPKSVQDLLSKHEVF